MNPQQQQEFHRVYQLSNAKDVGALYASNEADENAKWGLPATASQDARDRAYVASRRTSSLVSAAAAEEDLEPLTPEQEREKREAERRLYQEGQVQPYSDKFTVPEPPGPIVKDMTVANLPARLPIKVKESQPSMERAQHAITDILNDIWRRGDGKKVKLSNPVVRDEIEKGLRNRFKMENPAFWEDAKRATFAQKLEFVSDKYVAGTKKRKSRKSRRRRKSKRN
jgi:hypothetical protein